jgi:hypothetical protein
MKSIGLKICLAVSMIAAVRSYASPCFTEFKFSEELNQTYRFLPQGSLELQNINGDVHISGWDNDLIQVSAIKRASAKTDLEKARIQIDAEADAIKISTVYEKSHAWDCEHNGQADVEFNIMVPRTARLAKVELVNGNLSITNITGLVRASSVNGNVSANGLEGLTYLSTVSGKLEAVFNRVGSGIELLSLNGPLSVTLPSDVNAELEASTVKGEIENNFSIPVQDPNLGKALRAEMGNGGARIRIKNVNGTVSIRHVSDGKPLSQVREIPKRTWLLLNH